MVVAVDAGEVEEDATEVVVLVARGEVVTALSGAAAQLSDRLSIRHFAHSQLDSHALAT